MSSRFEALARRFQKLPTRFGLIVVRCLALLLTAVLFSGQLACSEESSGDFVSLRLRNPDASVTPEIKAELALSPSQRSLGLMYRKSMPEQQGMLFIFPDEKPRSFWMKNTYLPLDIIYFSSEKRVVSISESATPLTTTARPSKKPAQLVLELNAGLAKKWGIREGSELIHDEPLPEVRE